MIGDSKVRGRRQVVSSAERARRASRARAVSARRKRVDPVTCDRDYSAEELEFMAAVQAYKQRTGRAFPGWGEVLNVAIELGYRKPDPGPESGRADVGKGRMHDLDDHLQIAG